MAFNFSPKVVTEGLVLALDAANPRSYVSGSLVWNDLTKNQFTGSLVNGPTFNNANGGSIVFDGSDDRSIFGDPQSLKISNKLTVAAWINGTQWIGKPVRSICARWGDAGSQRSYKLAIVGNFGPPVGTAYLDVTGNGAGDNYMLSSVVLSLNTWNHVVGVYDGINILIYVNGVDRSQTLVGTVPSSLYIGSSSFIVGDDSTTTQNAFAGYISNVQIYNRALSATEVLQNYNATKGRFGLT